MIASSMTHMMTDRQKQILSAIIREFMKEADAVGSRNLVSKYKIGVSPATVRNEMVVLADKGYIAKSHISSGRVPTDLGLKFFVHELMDEEPIPNTDEVQVRIRVHKDRFDENALMNNILGFLSSETGSTAISLVGDTLRFRGISSLMDFEELRDVEVMEVLLQLLESKGQLDKILQKSFTDGVCVIIGQECDMDGLKPCAIVFSKFKYFGGKNGYIGVIGPKRMRYARVIPAVRTVSTMIEDAVRGW